MGVKYCGLTVIVLSILRILSMIGEDGILGVAVECVDIKKNTDSEGSLLGQY